MQFAKRRKHSQRQKGVSAIIGGVILFAMILSVLGSYFYIIQQSMNQYQGYVNKQINQGIATNKESFSVVGWIKSVGSCNPCIFANVTNNAGATLLITQAFVMNSSNGAVLKAYSIPLAFQGVDSFTMSAINTTQPYKSGSIYIIRVVSSNGNTAQTLYPTVNNQLTRASVQSLIASGLGSVSMIFKSFNVYKVNSCGTCPSGYSVDLAHKYNGSLAPCCDTISIGFSVQVTNVDPNQGTIALASTTMMWGSASCFSGCGNGNPLIWYIGNVDPVTGSISSTFSTVYLRYNTTQTLWLVSNCAIGTSSCATFSVVPPATTPQPPPFTFANFILLAGTYSANGMAAPYGQNIPFESTVFTDNIALASNSPGSVVSGTSSQPFSLTINNTALTPTSDKITKIVMSVDPLFTGVNAPAMPGWQVSYSGNTITWTATSSTYYIPANSVETFLWTANVPTVTFPTNFIHTITVTFSNGQAKTLSSIAAGTYVHT